VAQGGLPAVEALPALAGWPAGRLAWAARLACQAADLPAAADPSTSCLLSRASPACLRACLPAETYMRTIVPIGFLYAGTLWLGNAAYIYLSVSFIQMLKVGRMCRHLKMVR
jgi:hypothetical protein